MCLSFLQGSRLKQQPGQFVNDAVEVQLHILGFVKTLFVQFQIEAKLSLDTENDVVDAG
jgi:hypothetical protein